MSTETTESDGWEWAIVEIFGHRRHAGRAREEERFGAKMLRIDVPMKGDPAANGWETHWYGGSSIFSYTLTDEASALRINKPYEAPTRYSLPAPDYGDDYGEIELPTEEDRIKAAADRAEERSKLNGGVAAD
jgi:hypothetical protein